VDHRASDRTLATLAEAALNVELIVNATSGHVSSAALTVARAEHLAVCA
jgi:hypothetical protein